jgi:hypothetical protein
MGENHAHNKKTILAILVVSLGHAKPKQQKKTIAIYNAFAQTPE